MAQTDAQLQPVANGMSLATTAKALTGNPSTGALAASRNAELQQRYDSLFGQCMSARGEVPAVTGVAQAGAVAPAGPQPLAVAQADPPTPGTATPVASPAVEEIFKAAGLKRRGNELRDECDTAVTPAFQDIHLGGVVGDAIEVDTPDGLCFGGAGSQVTVLRRLNGRMAVIEQDNAARLIFFPTAHHGVADIGLSEPGLDVPVLQFDGRKYVTWKTVTVHGYTM